VKLDHEGKLEGRPLEKEQLLPRFEAEFAACQALLSGSDAAGARSRSPRQAARFLRIRTALLAQIGRSAELADTAEALLAKNCDEPEDLYEIGRTLAWCSGRIDPKQWRGAPPQKLDSLRMRLGDRAIALLARAVDRGLSYPHRLDDDDFLRPIREHPGFRQIAEHLSAPHPPSPKAAAG